LTKRDAEGLFDLILKFAGYGFNKSHSTGYAMVAFQTAFLKTYFPVQYMSAVLTYESVSTEKVAKYIEEAGRMSHGDHVGIAVRPPDVNISGIGFTPAFDRDEVRDPSHGHIRFGLGAIRGVGSKAVQAILEARDEAGPFKDLFDFCERVPTNAANKTTIEALVKCGAFDSVHGCEARAALAEAIESAIARGQRAAADRRSGQTNLFELFSAGPAAEPEACRLPDTPPWSASETLREEKAVLGFYVSSHPLEQHAATLERYSTSRAGDLGSLAVETDVTIGGLVTALRKVTARRGRMQGQTMGIITLEDPSGPVEIVAFPAVWAKVATVVVPDQLIFARGKIKDRDGQRSIALDSVVPLELADSLAVGCRIRLPEIDRCPLDPPLTAILKELRGLLLDAGSSNGGTVPLRLELPLRGQLVVIAAGVSRVAASAAFARRVDDLLATPGACRFLGPSRLAAPVRPNELEDLAVPPLMPGFEEPWELGAPN
jgi:DNA polymerase-3 subunit alpha